VALFIAVPNASHAVVEVATGTAVKTVLQVATPSTTDIRIIGWGISFDGIVAADPAGVVTLIDVDVAATVTALSPTDWGSDDNQNSLCVSGTSATGYNGSAEGSIAASKIIDPQEVHPQSGYGLWFPEMRQPRVKASRFLRIRCLFSVTVNCVPWIVWQEPA
jgi:hypothetical protein